MPTTKTLPKPIAAWQIKRIMANCKYNEDIKAEWVQWATADSSKTSLRSISFREAMQIIHQQEGKAPLLEGFGEAWGKFDAHNEQHRYIMSLLRQANITVQHTKYGEIADMYGWFARFLKSKRCPVQMPLLKMQPKEVSKIITALEGVAVWKNSI